MTERARLLEVENLTVEFRTARGEIVHAVSGVTLDIQRGETLGLVGESGCGKSTLARAIIQLPRPQAGSVRLNGDDLTAVAPDRLRQLRRRFQIVFQDPIASLNPRQTSGEIVGAPLDVTAIGSRAERRAKVSDMLDAVGLDPKVAMDKRPHEFSGGQCQRLSIARALILEPDLLICDEPVSALDVSIQAQILNLLREMKQRYDLTMLFISHDLAVVKNVSDRVAVMYLGKICEIGPAQELYRNPAHPYTRALLSAIPTPDPNAPKPDLQIAQGELPSPIAPPSGCRFRTRCPIAQPICATKTPAPQAVGRNRSVACHHALV